MAGDWIVWTKGLPRRIEVSHIADALGVSRYEAACHCMAAWEWADENTTDGCASGITPERLSDLVNVPGIAQAMVAVGWLLSDGGGVIFPNWSRWNTESAKKRLQDRDRKRRERVHEIPDKKRTT